MKNHLNILFSFLFISLFSFAQLEIIDDSDNNQFELNLADFEKKPNQVVFRGFFLDKKGYNNDKIYKCLHGFNSELFDFKFYNSVRTDVNTRKLITEIKNSRSIDDIQKLITAWESKVQSSKELNVNYDGKQRAKEPIFQSKVYFCIKSEQIIKLLTPDIMQSLSIQEETNLDLEKSKKVYCLKDIRDGNSELCYKLQQLFLFFEAHKELLNKTDDQSPYSEFNIQLQSSGLYGIAPKIKLKNSLYNSNHNVQSMIGFNFKIMAFQKTSLKEKQSNSDYGFGLGYSRNFITTTNSIENQSFSTTWTHPQLQGDQIKNIYLNDVTEQSDLTLNTLHVPLSLRFKCDNKLNFQFNVTPSFVLPSNITSRITSGNISYRGQVEGIDDELYNISELGLFDNISLNQSTTQKYSGWGIEFGGNISHVFKTGSVFIGVGYNFQRLKSDFSNERLHLSSDVTDYNSSFSSADGFSLSAIMLNVGISINLNSSEK